MSEPSLDDVLIAIARIEAKQDAMMEEKSFVNYLKNQILKHFKTANIPQQPPN